MALFKVYRGNSAGLDAVAKRDGNCYFCLDSRQFHIDYLDDSGVLQRKPINAADAETLAGMTVEEIIASAEEVQANLDAHTANKNNPHGVTAAQIGAATASNLTSHTGNTSNPHKVTAAQVGAVPTSRTVNGKALSANISLTATDVGADSAGSADEVQANLDAHIGDTSNPHGVTASQIGAATSSSLSSHTGNTSNPHKVTAAQVGADVAGAAATVQTNLDTHVASKSNPHNVTASQVGAVPTSRTVNGKALSSNISLTYSDVGADKSGAASTALSDAKDYTDEKVAELLNNSTDAVDSIMELAAAMEDNADAIDALETIASSKASASDLTSHTENKSNPHGVTYSQVGADKSGAAAAVQTNLDTHTTDKNNPHGVTISQIGAASATDLSSHTENKSNPHGVTASQVGLGNVPNVTTNNQTPTYTAATSLTALTSGEKLSVAFGKIAKAVSDLISHLANKSNPHGVTAAQVGAATTTALSSHTGSTSNPHKVTAAQVGADPEGAAEAVQTNLDTHTTDNNNPHKVTASQAGAAPTSHASTATTYGAGTGSNYGHVKLSDSTNSTSAASAGIAASPAAVKAAYDLANTAKKDAATAQTRADDAYSLADSKVASLSDLGVTATAAELNKLDGVTATTAELNYVDGVTSNIQTQLNGKAASSHGNHVPATQTASNKVFLRNDNTWQTVAPANIGAAPTSHASTATTYGIGTGSNYGHVKLSDSTSSTSAASAGVAASPKAVKAAYDLAATKAPKENGFHYIVGTGSTAGTWLATSDEITAYFDGLTVLYKVPVAGVSGTTTLNINSLGAVTVVRNASTAISTSFPVNSVVLLTYTTDSGTAYWKVADYDSNTKTTTSTTNKTGTKLFLAGATAQGSGQTTYSNSKCYVGTDNCLYSNSTKVSVDGHTHTAADVGAVPTTVRQMSVDANTLTTEGRYFVISCDNAPTHGFLEVKYYDGSLFAPNSSWGATQCIHQTLNAYTGKVYKRYGLYKTGSSTDWEWSEWTECPTRSQIQTGSYTGTGTYGASNPNTVTLSFVPKLFLVLPIGSTNGYMYYDPSTNGINRSYHTRTIGENCVIQLSGTTISWYTTAAANDAPTAQQGNLNGVCYAWYAFG